MPSIVFKTFSFLFLAVMITVIIDAYASAPSLLLNCLDTFFFVLITLQPLSASLFVYGTRKSVTYLK